MFGFKVPMTGRHQVILKKTGFQGYTKEINFNKDLDDKHYWTGRLGVTWRPTDKIENYLMGYNTWSRSNGPGMVGKGFNLGLDRKSVV